MLRWLAMAAIALALTLGSLVVRPATDEYAEYGNVGPAHENWRPRVVAGWPAPFVADRPGISVPRTPGPEDTFRAGSFVGSFSFWLLAVLATSRLIAGAGRGFRRQ